MRTPRIFHPQPLASNTTVELNDNAARHVARVLRLGEGAALTLFDGCGGEYPAILASLAKRRVVVELGQWREHEVESPLRLTLAQGVSKGDRMDFTIQKAVELGVSRIVPLSTERSVVNLKGERLEKKLAHWRGVIVSACEQCGRNSLPELLPLQRFGDWLGESEDDVRLLLDHRAEQSVSSVTMTGAATLLIGPEGGISAQERERAYAAGYQGLRLGPRVLRTETAALTALSVLQSRFGDLR
ncbi:MAG: 16S rRNA (uracil(1498)-N(3))-methyltransferase [Pseudomonadota bacterium]